MTLPGNSSLFPILHRSYFKLLLTQDLPCCVYQPVYSFTQQIILLLIFSEKIETIRWNLSQISITKPSNLLDWYPFFFLPSFCNEEVALF